MDKLDYERDRLPAECIVPVGALLIMIREIAERQGSYIVFSFSDGGVENPEVEATAELGRPTLYWGIGDEMTSATREYMWFRKDGTITTYCPDLSDDLVEWASLGRYTTEVVMQIADVP